MNIFFAGVVISIFIYLGIGLWAGRNIKGTDDYYVSGRNAGTLLISGTLFASMLSASGFTGDMGFAYSGNITNLVCLDLLAACGYVFGPLTFGRYLRRSECSTMPEYFGKRFCDKRNRRVAGITILFSLTAYLLSCINCIGLLMQELTGLPLNACLILSWAIFTIFTFYSGSKGVIITDTVMFLIFLLATILAGPFIFNAQGGIGELLTNLMNNPDAPANLLDYYGNLEGVGASTPFDGIMYGITFGIIWFITYAVSPWQAGRNMMAKSEHVTFRAGACACIAAVLFFVYLNVEAVAVVNLYPNMEDPQKVLIWAAFNVMPAFIGTLMLTGIMAAGLSSASTFLSVIGFSVTSDIFDLEFRDEKHKLRVSRFIMLGVGVFTLILTLLGVGGIRVVVYFASTIIAASWAIPGIGSVWSKKLSATGARLSMIAGFVVFLFFKCMVSLDVASFSAIFKNFLDPFFMGLYASLIFAVAGSILQPASEEEITYREQLIRVPESERNPEDYKKDKFFAVGVIVVGIVIALVMLFGWALPYNGMI